MSMAKPIDDTAFGVPGMIDFSISSQVSSRETKSILLSTRCRTVSSLVSGIPVPACANVGVCSIDGIVMFDS